MAVRELISWIDEHTNNSAIWYVKRLSANDTTASNAHQAGPYVPKKLIFNIIPELKTSNDSNPRMSIEAFVDSHLENTIVKVIYYNNKTRNEIRITGWGGKNSVLLDPDYTGALSVMVFYSEKNTYRCNIWVCRSTLEEELIEEKIGEVIPGKAIIWKPSQDLYPELSSDICRVTENEILKDWSNKFPTPEEVFNLTINKSQKSKKYQANFNSPDELLLNRFNCEWSIYKNIEFIIESQRILMGFKDLDEFIGVAQSILQRRKSRAGKSFELHTKKVFEEFGLIENMHFSYQKISEGNKRPDFLFPNNEVYSNSQFPNHKLRMLAVKTTCRDRWRQVLNEADRIRHKHLFTLQEGVSEGQFEEMKKSDVKLVVPSQNIDSFPKKVRGELLSLESFISEVRLLKDS